MSAQRQSWNPATSTVTEFAEQLSVTGKRIWKVEKRKRENKWNEIVTWQVKKRRDYESWSVDFTLLIIFVFFTHLKKKMVKVIIMIMITIIVVIMTIIKIIVAKTW